MSTARAYRSPRSSTRAGQTRARILAAVRALLADGGFHAATMEQIAQRAAISRAALYQHFRTRGDLVDAICDTFAVNPALVELRRTVALPDPDAALAETIAHAVRFWASEDAVLRELYGVVAIDPAAQALVERQRADRRGEMRRLARHLRDAGRLRDGLAEADALEALMVLTGYETFRELRVAGRSERRATRWLQDAARALLLAPA